MFDGIALNFDYNQFTSSDSNNEIVQQLFQILKEANHPDLATSIQLFASFTDLLVEIIEEGNWELLPTEAKENFLELAYKLEKSKLKMQGFTGFMFKLALLWPSIRNNQNLFYIFNLVINKYTNAVYGMHEASKLNDKNQSLETLAQTQSQSNKLSKAPRLRPASGHSLLRHANTWVGDDLEECLQKVYDTRSRL